MREPLDELRAALDQIRVEARSPRGHITLIQDERHNIRVRIRPGTVANTSARQLAADIRALLHQALAEYDRQYFAARRTVYGSSLGLGGVGEAHA
jgi:hypothetical protein